MTAPDDILQPLQSILPHAQLRQYQLSQLNNLTLWLIDDIGDQQPLTEQQTDSVWQTPPYWAFCWGSGQVIAQWLLANSAKVAGSTVIDFGSGSGIVAIAAALAGAKTVYACDIDPTAIAASLANAALNNVSIIPVFDLSQLPKADWLFAADVLYDPDNRPLLQQFPIYADKVMLADSRVKQFQEPNYYYLSQQFAVTLPDLGENEDVKTVRLYVLDSKGRV